MKMKKIELTEKDFDRINDLSFRQVAKKFNITPASAKKNGRGLQHKWI